MSTALRALLLAVVFTLLPVGVGVAMTGGHRSVTPPAAYTPTSLQRLDTTTIAVARSAFCDRIPGLAVTAALGRAATYAHQYVDGQRQSVPGSGPDVVHEDGCVFRAAGSEARAWVFAPPVTRQRAGRLAAVRAKGCTKALDAAAFGAPTSATVCGRSPRTVTYAGLFGDAWLSCSLSAPVATAALVARGGQWCAAVAQAAAG